MPFDSDFPREIHAAPLVRLAPDGSWQTRLAHSRCDHLLIWITRGQGRLLLNGEQRGFGLHSVIFIPAGTLWSADFGRQCLGQVLTMSGPLLPPFPEEPEHKRFASLQEQTSLAGHFEAISREQSAREPHWNQAVQARCELAAVALRRQPASTGKQTAAQRLCRAYCQRITSLQAGQLSMADHAAALNVTPTHLTRVCKTATGKTAAALLTERQLHAARTLLITSDLPIRDIASRLGFGSAAYFTRFISQHTGQPPRGLREPARRQPQ